MKNKYLQIFTMILYSSLMQTTIGSVGELGERVVNMVQLRAVSGEIMDGSFTLTEAESQLVNSAHYRRELKRILNDRFNPGPMREGVIFYNFVAAFSSPGGLVIEDGKLTVTTVKHLTYPRFQVDEDRIYILDQRYIPKIYMLNYMTEPGQYYDSSNVFEAHLPRIALYSDNVDLLFLERPILNYSDLIELCDAIDFVSVLSETRGTNLKDTILFLEYFIDDMRDMKESLFQSGPDEYLLRLSTAKGDRICELFLRNEGESPKVSYEKFDDLSKVLPDEHGGLSDITLSQIKFFDQEYTFQGKWYFLHILDYMNIKKILFDYLVSRFSNDTNHFIQWKDVLESMNLKDVFGQMEKDLAFIASFAQKSGINIVKAQRYFMSLNYIHPIIHRCDSIVELKSGHAENDSVQVRDLDLEYELVIKGKLKCEIDDADEITQKPILLDSIKFEFGNKEYMFKGKIHFEMEKTFKDISIELRSYLSKTFHLPYFFGDLQGRWDSIDLVDSMMPIELGHAA